jgi:serine/threonine protein kinase
MDQRFVYEQEIIGSGGFGKVRKGRDQELERNIAIKTLDPILSEFSETDVERFKREARVLASLSHPNIPAIYDVDFSPGKFSIIFQHIDGTNLQKLIEQNGPAQIGAARVWFHQIASALEHAHKLGIVHRDVKPENIIVTPDLESAYLVDFGIALTAEEAKRLTKSGYAIGTVGYMSPEQLSGESVDGRSDIYSLGVTLYEALAGKRMPQGGYEPLSSNEAISPLLDDLVLDCLEPQSRRIDSARVFQARLAGALTQPSKPLSDVLAHGKLHELSSAIENLTPTEFDALPPGQKVLIISKVVDVVGSNEYRLQYAAERFLQLMLTRAILLDKEDYREIVEPAIRWGFETDFDGGLGKESIRRTLEEAAFLARGGGYEVLQEELLKFILRVESLEDKEDWYLHTVREVVEAMMANPSCDDGAKSFGEFLRKINRAQRSKPWRASSATAY